MHLTSRAKTPFDPSIPKRPGWEGMKVHWLADREHGSTETTVFNVTEFPPNRSHEVHRHPDAEEYFFLLEGAGLHLTDGEPVPLEEGDLVFVPKGEWHGFANNTDRPALAVTVMGGVAHYSDAGYEVLPGTEGERSVLGLVDAINDGNPEAGVAVADPEIEFLSVLAVSGRAYIGHDGIHEYFDDVASAWKEWRVEVHRVATAPDGRVVIAMTMHMLGKESGAPLAQRAAHVWTLRNGKLLRNQLFREPEEALRAVGLSP